jgi:hypothetical protein
MVFSPPLLSPQHLPSELHISVPKLTHSEAFMLASICRVTGFSFSALVRNAAGAEAYSPLRPEEYG